MPDILFTSKQPSDVSAPRFSQGASLGMLIGIVLFVMALATYGALFAVNKNQRQNFEILRDEVKSKEQRLQSDYFNQIFVLQDQLKSIRSLLNNHVFARNILTTLEADTHPQVRFSTFNFDSQNLHLDMAGEAASFSVFSQQIGIFEKDPHIKSVDFGGLSVSEDNFVRFNLTIIFDPAILHVLPSLIASENSPVSSTSTPSVSPVPTPTPSTPIKTPTPTPKPKAPIASPKPTTSNVPHPPPPPAP